MQSAISSIASTVATIQSNTHSHHNLHPHNNNHSHHNVSSRGGYENGSSTVFGEVASFFGLSPLKELLFRIANPGGKWWWVQTLLAGGAVVYLLLNRLKRMYQRRIRRRPPLIPFGVSHPIFHSFSSSRLHCNSFLVSLPSSLFLLYFLLSSLSSLSLCFSSLLPSSSSLLQRNDEEYDVCVVGAGPAGAACAYFLARKGRKVLLLERKTIPRDKLCGDAVAPRAQR
jgi:hypothetical protein